MKNQLAVEGLILEDSEIMHTFEDIDHGVEWCEEQIIRSVEKDSDTSVTFKENNDDVFKDVCEQLSEYLEDWDIPADTTIIAQGKRSGGIYFLQSGHVTVRLETSKGKYRRLKYLGPGTVVGEVSLYLETKASATVVSDEACHIKFLSVDNFTKINKEIPEKTIGLHRFVVKLLSERLAESNAAIQELMR